MNTEEEEEEEGEGVRADDHRGEVPTADLWGIRSSKKQEIIKNNKALLCLALMTQSQYDSGSGNTQADEGPQLIYFCLLLSGNEKEMISSGVGGTDRRTREDGEIGKAPEGQLASDIVHIVKLNESNPPSVCPTSLNSISCNQRIKAQLWALN